MLQIRVIHFFLEKKPIRWSLEMKRTLKVFEKEIESYAQELGEGTAVRALLVFSTALYWLRKWGHGNLVLSAVNHSFGLKIRAYTVLSVKEN